MRIVFLPGMSGHGSFWAPVFECLPAHEPVLVDWPGLGANPARSDVHGYDELPRVTNPPTGFVQNTNDPPWFPTWPTPVRTTDYPSYLAPQVPLSMRAQNSRIEAGV